MTLEGLNDDFRDIVVLFAQEGVEFVIVGAYALAFHGAPRASGDIDLSTVLIAIVARTLRPGSFRTSLATVKSP